MADFGRSPAGRAGRPTDQAPAGLGDAATIPNAALVVMAELNAGLQAEFNRVAGTDNWRMLDTPKMENEWFDKLLAIFGEGNYRIIIGSQGNFRIRDGKSETSKPWTRATLLLSPEAVENAQRYAQGIEAQRAETTQIGSVEDESPVPQGCAQTQSSTPDNKDKPNA